jgi:glucose/arabinose dehydrogenase
MRRFLWFLLGVVVGVAGAGYWARGPLTRLDDVESQLDSVQGQLRSVRGNLARSPARLRDVVVKLERVASVIDPVDAGSRAGDDGLFVATRPGKIFKVDSARHSADPEPILDISRDVDTQKARAGTGGEAGLLGFAFSPDGDRLYVTYTEEWEEKSPESVIWTLVEFRMRGDKVDLASRRRLLAVRKVKPHHNGGAVRFGPDGYLYTSIGDGWPFGDDLETGQNPDDLLGNIIRIDPRPNGDRPYSTPGDNPFAEGGGRPEIWAYGLRNPWRFSFDRITGDLWIADVGDHEQEEIDLLEASRGGGRGANLGWSVFEGTDARNEDASPDDYTAPIHTYRRRKPFCAIIGGFVYRGSAIPSLRGAYLYSDYCDGTLRALAINGDDVSDRSLRVEVATPSSFAEDDAGELYVISLQGDVFRIAAA